MDLKEASAVTEPSGLTNEMDVNEQTSGPHQRPLRSPSQQAALR